MPELTCTVDSCYYNKRDCCCKGEIEIAGQNADRTEDTCCSSFEERKRDSFSNAEEHPCRTITVGCQAASCAFNDDYVCQAKDIGISGSHACKTDDTECASFRCS